MVKGRHVNKCHMMHVILYSTEQNFVDILYQLLRDRDPQVVSNSISALDEILASEGGMVVNTKISLYLLGRLVLKPFLLHI